MSNTTLLAVSVGASLISLGSVFYTCIHRRRFWNSCKRNDDRHEIKIVEEKQTYDIEQGFSIHSDLTDTEFANTDFANFESASFTSDSISPRDTVFPGNDNTQSGDIEEFIEVQPGRNHGRKENDFSELVETSKETVSLQIPSNYEMLDSTENDEESSKKQEHCNILNSSLVCMVQDSDDDKSNEANKNAFQEVLTNHETELDETNVETVSHQITSCHQKLHSLENDEESSKTQEYCKMLNSSLLCMVQNFDDQRSEKVNSERDFESIQTGEYTDSTHGVSEVFDESIHTSIDESTIPSSENNFIKYDDARSVEEPDAFIRDDSSVKSKDATENFSDDSDSEATSVTGSRWIQSLCSSSSDLNSGYEGEYEHKHEDTGDDEEIIQANDDISDLSSAILSAFDYDEEYKHKLGGIAEGKETLYGNDGMSDVSSTFLTVFGHEEEYDHKQGHIEEEETSRFIDDMSDVSSTFLSVFGHEEDTLVHMEDEPSRFIDDMSDITSKFSSILGVNSEDSFTYSIVSNHSRRQNNDDQIEFRDFDKENPPHIKEKPTASSKRQKPKPESFTLKSRQNLMRQNRLGSLETVKEVQEVESRSNELQYVSSSDDDESPNTSYQNGCVDAFSCGSNLQVAKEIPSTYVPRSGNIPESIPKTNSQDTEIKQRTVEEILRGSIHHNEEATQSYMKSGSFEERYISLCERTSSSSTNLNISFEENSYSGKPLSPTTDLGSTYSYNDHTDIVSDLISVTSNPSPPNLCPICSQETTLYQSIKYSSNPLCIHTFHSNCMTSGDCPICTNTARNFCNGNENKVRSSI